VAADFDLVCTIPSRSFLQFVLMVAFCLQSQAKHSGIPSDLAGLQSEACHPARRLLAVGFRLTVTRQIQAMRASLAASQQERALLSDRLIDLVTSVCLSRFLSPLL
jgi:hypothetical protein